MYGYGRPMGLAPYRYRILVANASPSPGGAQNVFNVGNDVLLTDAQVNTILGHIKTWYTAFSTYVYGSFTIGSRVLEFRPGVVAPRIVLATPAAQSSAISTPQPPQLAAVMSWRTALAGKSFRGRTFLGPLNIAALSSGTLAAAFTGTANTASTTLISAVKGVTNPAWGLVVHSDHMSEDTPITNGVMDARVDTMRSRA